MGFLASFTLRWRLSGRYAVVFTRLDLAACRGLQLSSCDRLTTLSNTVDVFLVRCGIVVNLVTFAPTMLHGCSGEEQESLVKFFVRDQSP